MIRRDVLKTFAGMLAVPAAALVGPGATADAAQEKTTPDPWTAAQTISPAAFAKELADSKAGDRPTIVCVGFRNFYEGAHIPGASYHGPASTAEGLDDLKKFASGLPSTTDLAIYCGCCPLVHCPNVRPAFSALVGMGFARVRLLALQQSFASDWMKPGYPVSKRS
ncbi:MAG TPA: hypothetical protein VJS43_15705 [Candidatus Acidoferrales bacterium]|nr:hypothetical protein [Candidatus Acidoferrales bacterium]